MKDSSLTASDSQTYQSPEQKALFTRALERFPMRLSHQDGVVSAVCPTDADPTWVVNVKKGILSALQNSMQDLGMGTNTTEVGLSWNVSDAFWKNWSECMSSCIVLSGTTLSAFKELFV